MKVEVTTDGNVAGTRELFREIEGEVNAALARHLHSLTRVEVHLGDENGGKSGGSDKRCMVEARAEGRAPIAVTHHAGSMAEAVRDALKKVARLLERQTAKENDRKGGTSIRHLEVDEGARGG